MLSNNIYRIGIFFLNLLFFIDMKCCLRTKSYFKSPLLWFQSFNWRRFLELIDVVNNEIAARYNIIELGKLL